MAEKPLSPEELKEATKLAAQLGKSFDTTKESATAIRDRIKAWRIELGELNSNINDTYSSFVKITNELKNTNIASQNIKKAYSSLTSIAEKLQFAQQGISELSLKDINSLKERIKLEEQRIANSLNLLEQERKAALANKDLDKAKKIDELQKEYKKQQDELNKSVVELNNQLKLQEDLLKKQNNLLGLGGNLIGGMSEAMDKLGLSGLKNFLNFDKAKKAMDETSLSISQGIENGNKLTVLSRGLSALFSGFGKALLDPLTIFSAMLKGFLDIDKAQVEFARETSRNLDTFDTLNTSLITTVDYIKQATAMTQQLGFQADLIFTPETLQEATEMVELMGMSAEQAGRMAVLSKVSGKELKSVNETIISQVNNFNKANKSAISQKQILNDVSSVSDEVAASLGGNPERIAAAALEARKLGLNLEQVDKIASSLLNFESSIQNELEAEVLTGKQLNLEQARYLALTNDLEGLSKEIGKNQEILATFSSGNRIEQEAIAKSLGLSRGEIQKMIFQQQISAGLSEEAAAKAAGANLEEMKRLSIQDSIQKSLDKIAQAFAPILGFIADIVSKWYILYPLIGLVALSYMPKIVGGIKSFYSGIVDSVKGFGDLIKNMFKLGEAKKLVDAAPAAGGGGGISSITNSFSKINMSSVLKGAAALLIVASSIFVLGKAVQQFEGIGLDTLGIVGLSILGLVTSLALVGAIMSSGVGAVALLAGAAAMVVIAGAIFVLGKALQEFKPPKEFIDFVTTLKFENVAALALLGPALISASLGLGAFALALTGVGIASFIGGGVISEIKTIASLAEPLNSVANSLGLMATALLGVSSALNSIDAKKMETLSEFAEKSALSAAAQGITTAITAPIQAISAIAGGGGNESMAAELKEIKNILTQMLNKEGVVYLDGNRVGTTLSTGTTSYRN
jgi:hypothetical protein